jgi:hypothetical protein
MTPAKKIEKYLEKRGVKVNAKLKAAQKKADISTTAKQKELLIAIAADLGYIQE